MKRLLAFSEQGMRQMEKIRLIVADHDGTLVDDDRILSPYTRDVLERLHEKGILFGMASGRNVSQIREYAHKWGLSFDFDMVIGNNGGELWDNVNQKHYEYEKLSADAIMEILEMMKPLDLTLQFHYNGLTYVERIDKYVQESIDRNHNADEIRIIKSMDDIKDVSIFKLMYRVPPERMQEVMDYVNARPSENFKGFRTQIVNFEFVNGKVNKGKALERFCNLNDIPLTQAMAFGDTSNDNEMLQVAHGVCLCNGTKDTLALADYITEYDNNHDGFARFVEEHVLNQR